WDCGRYQNKLKDDCSILEDTHIHEIMHNIIYNTIKDSSKKIAIDWTRKTSEEGNEKVDDLDYDIWLSQMNAMEQKIQQTTFHPPYQSTTVRTEENRRKLIQFMSRSYKFGVITTLINIQLPLHSQVDKNLVKNYLISLVIFRRRILEAIEGMKKLSDRCNNHMITQQNDLYIICNNDDEKENIFSLPQRMKRVKLVKFNNAKY
ncbi:17957_t:CDS:2, partial [Cetraspora pellucida]